MVIRTFEHEYPVIGVKESGEQYDTYICRDVSNGGMCRIMSIKDRSMFPEIVSWLTDTINRQAFTDYREHFIFDGQLCIVMKFTQGVTLSARLATESVPFRERLEIGRRLLEKVVLQDIPDHFLAKCFEPEHIVLDKDLTVSFNYPIEEIINERSSECKRDIETVFRLLFEKELARKVPDLLMAFFKRLPVLTEMSMIDLYSEYYLMMGKLEKYDESSEQPKTFWYKLWNKIKKLLSILKKLLIILLIVLSIVYLIYTIIDPNKNKNSNGHFKSIGTVEIENSE